MLRKEIITAMAVLSLGLFSVQAYAEDNTTQYFGVFTGSQNGASSINGVDVKGSLDDSGVFHSTVTKGVNSFSAGSFGDIERFIQTSILFAGYDVTVTFKVQAGLGVYYHFPDGADSRYGLTADVMASFVPSGSRFALFATYTNRITGKIADSEYDTRIAIAYGF